ncbi:hypothetical protein BpHYR1_053323 [Brachionus plicatilis]|uniref:Uncharacterized protein n=1 Tax=Brachionus plicatilis TaxID=10195 RepID=A0A3M7P2U9_BRAPC|nr:hypothetical protein BpHYR1_053323 [Brachionus plicatilis]
MEKDDIFILRSERFKMKLKQNLNFDYLLPDDKIFPRLKASHTTYLKIINGCETVKRNTLFPWQIEK